jgi:hypothetical protein
MMHVIVTLYCCAASVMLFLCVAAFTFDGTPIKLRTWLLASALSALWPLTLLWCAIDAWREARGDR